MNILKQDLVNIIREEISKYKKERESERKKIQRQRSRNFRGGDLMSLANCIVEEDDDGEDESKRTGSYKKCQGVGNQWHDKDGRFSSKSAHSSNSLYFSCPDYKFRTRKNMKAISDPVDSGRGKNKNKGKGRWRVRDNKPLWESDLEIDHPQHDDNKLDGLYMRHIMRQELKRLGDDIEREFRPRQKTQGGCSLDDILKVIRKWKSAEHYKPSKNKK